MDTTYKCVPKTIDNFKLMVISGYDFNNKKRIMLFYINHERKRVYIL